MRHFWGNLFQTFIPTILIDLIEVKVKKQLKLSFLTVCADTATMTLRVGAKLMSNLGCDYAASLGGGGAVQMRILDPGLEY